MSKIQKDFENQAFKYIDLLGGVDNLVSYVPCATRLRIRVRKTEKVAAASLFKQAGAVEIVVHQTAIQVIVGLDAPEILDHLRRLVQKGTHDFDSEDEYGLTQAGEDALMLYECFGIDGNITLITSANNRIFITVKDLSWVDPFNVILELGIGITSIKIIDHLVILECSQAEKLAREMLRRKYFSNSNENNLFKKFKGKNNV